MQSVTTQILIHLIPGEFAGMLMSISVLLGNVQIRGFPLFVSISGPSIPLDDEGSDTKLV